MLFLVVSWPQLTWSKHDQMQFFHERVSIWEGWSAHVQWSISSTICWAHPCDPWPPTLKMMPTLTAPHLLLNTILHPFLCFNTIPFKSVSKITENQTKNNVYRYVDWCMCYLFYFPQIRCPSNSKEKWRPSESDLQINHWKGWCWWFWN